MTGCRTVEPMAKNISEDMDRFRSLGRSAFVLGYTGLTGKALVSELNKAKIFTKVVLIGRREVPLDVGPEFEQRVVNFDKIEEFQDVFQGLENGFCCLGVPSGGGISTEDYIRITLDYVVGSAKLAREQGCKHISLVTGSGTKKNSWFLFGRVKAELEEKIEDMNFERFTIYRPGLILGERPESRFANQLSQVMFKPIYYFFPTLMSIPDHTLAKGMIHAAVRHPPAGSRELYENKAIHQLAKDTYVETG